MALLFRVSWLCMLLWGCVSFAPQTGYSVAHGYRLYRSSQPSSRLTSGEVLKPNDEVETNAIMLQSFVSLQREHLNPARGFGGKVGQSHPGFVHKADTSRNQVWSKLDNLKMPDRRHSSNIPVYSAENVLSSKVHDSQRSVPHLYNHLGASELVSNATADAGLSGGPSGFSTSVSNHIHPSYKQPEQTRSPSRSFLGDNSVTGHMTDSFFDTSNRPSQDSSFFSRKRSISLPSTHKQNIQKPKYLHHRNDFSAGYPSDGSYSKELHQVTHAGGFPQRKPSSSGRFVQKNEMHFPNSAAKTKKKTAKLFTCQSGVDKKSNHGCYVPTHQMTTSGRSLLNTKDHLPKRRDQMDFRANALYKPQQELDKSNLVFSEKPSRSTKHSGHLGYQKVPVDPLYNQNVVSALQKQNKNTKAKPRGMNWTQKEVSSKKARNQLSSVSDQDRFLFQNGGYEDALRAGLMKTYNHPNVFQVFSEPTNLAFWPSELEADPLGLDPNCIVWKSTVRSPPPKFSKSSRFFANTYAKLKKRSTRATALLSKTCYITIQQGQGKEFNRYRKPARRWRI